MQIFEGKEICLMGRHSSMKNVVIKNGGRFVPSVTPFTSFLVSSSESVSRKTADVVRALDQGIPIVSLDYIHDCAKEHRLLTVDEYNLIDESPPVEEDGSNMTAFYWFRCLEVDENLSNIMAKCVYNNRIHDCDALKLLSVDVLTELIRSCLSEHDSPCTEEDMNTILAKIEGEFDIAKVGLLDDIFEAEKAVKPSLTDRSITREKTQILNDSDGSTIDDDDADAVVKVDLKRKHEDIDEGGPRRISRNLSMDASRLELASGKSRSLCKQILDVCGGDMHTSLKLLVDGITDREIKSRLDDPPSDDVVIISPTIPSSSSSSSGDPVEMLMSISGQSYVSCATALEACDFCLSSAVKLLLRDGENDVEFEPAVTAVVSNLASETSMSESCARTALEYCNEDIDQARGLLLHGPLELGALNCLNDLQKRALKYVATRARESSSKAYPRLQTRLRKMGYSNDDLDRTMRYIRDLAPIIIHFNCKKVMKFFVKDSHYRNLFEIGTGSGCTNQTVRAGWEDRIFDSIYRDADPVDRVKYGCFNLVQDPAGVESARHYGSSYFVLKNIRLRTTFSDADTSAVCFCLLNFI